MLIAITTIKLLDKFRNFQNLFSPIVNLIYIYILYTYYFEIIQDKEKLPKLGRNIIKIK